MGKACPSWAKAPPPATLAKCIRVGHKTGAISNPAPPASKKEGVTCARGREVLAASWVVPAGLPFLPAARARVSDSIRSTKSQIGVEASSASQTALEFLDERQHVGVHDLFGGGDLLEPAFVD